MVGRKPKVAKGRREKAFTPPRSPLRVMNIVEELGSKPMGLPLVRLCDQLGVPQTSLLSLLRALEESRYVVNEMGLYRLGEASLRMSSVIAVSFPFPHSLHNLLSELMTSCNETAMLAELTDDGQEAIYIDKVECQRTLRFSNFIGAKRVLYCTAVGQVLLAFQDEPFISNYLNTNKLIPLGPRTITSKDRLKEKLIKIREEGVASTIEEGSEGIGAISAPVFDGFGKIKAAVSVGAPAQRARAMRKRYSKEVRRIAQEMSHLLGWKPNP